MQFVDMEPMTIRNTEGDVQINPKNVSVDATPTTCPFEHRFNPYDFNGGTTVVIAGEDFAIAAGCTRMSTGYSILSRKQSKLIPFSDKTILASVGCVSDITTLNRTLTARLTQYQHNQGKVMNTNAVAQLLSVTLYSRRFFPYYSFCLLAGLDEEGKGAVYGYDAIGSFKRDEYGAMGTGQKFVMPLLDNLVGHKNRADPNTPLTLEQAISIVKEVFVIAAERDIHTGDSVEIKIIKKSGIVTETFNLKTD
eukprot:TRINITY_DN8763_c0_g1_i1.p1 TRINITY_DN8763_c0_g1~~TRINITY_DN8763_c0_g1_i1.p1  ORF type:complete len:251 (+),score=-12.75 TRINITY_DN8763_c0_g1_i1:64-816(+)